MSKTLAQLDKDIKFIQVELHPYYTGKIDGDFGGGSKAALASMKADAERYRFAILGSTASTPPAQAASRIFTEADYLAAAVRIKAASGTARPLPELIAAIKAFKEVESGNGWFTDVARINALDGPGGWLNGQDLPKILFEAHHFDKYSGGKFRASHPNLSSARWNKALYVGGPGEWERLWRAMQLDKNAALLSASVGTFQIMGFNFKTAGFDNVQAFWDAHMQGGAAAHMEAFVSFIINTKGLAAKVARIDGNKANCTPAALAYNGPRQADNNYDGKIAAAYRKFIAA